LYIYVSQFSEGPDFYWTGPSLASCHRPCVYRVFSSAVQRTIRVF